VRLAFSRLTQSHKEILKLLAALSLTKVMKMKMISVAAVVSKLDVSLNEKLTIY